MTAQEVRQNVRHIRVHKKYRARNKVCPPCLETDLYRHICPLEPHGMYVGKERRKKTEQQGWYSVVDSTLQM